MKPVLDAATVEHMSALKLGHYRFFKVLKAYSALLLALGLSRKTRWQLLNQEQHGVLETALLPCFEPEVDQSEWKHGDGGSSMDRVGGTHQYILEDVVTLRSLNYYVHLDKLNETDQTLINTESNSLPEDHPLRVTVATIAQELESQEKR